jgi:hypothetical protein
MYFPLFPLTRAIISILLQFHLFSYTLTTKHVSLIATFCALCQWKSGVKCITFLLLLRRQWKWPSANLQMSESSRTVSDRLNYQGYHHYFRRKLKTVFTCGLYFVAINHSAVVTDLASYSVRIPIKIIYVFPSGRISLGNCWGFINSRTSRVRVTILSYSTCKLTGAGWIAGCTCIVEFIP